MVDSIWFPSPNFGDNRKSLSYVILHGTWMDSDREALARLCDPAAEVSCHYLIDQQGVLYKLVDEEKVAWHAGKSSWDGIESLNFHSIGIEVSNPGIGKGVDYHEAQYLTLEKLLVDIMQRLEIKAENVLGHEDVAPDRKDDPGPHFDWQRLVDKGLAIRP